MDSDNFQFEKKDFGVVDEYLDKENDLYSSDIDENMESTKNLLDGESNEIPVVKIEEDDKPESPVLNNEQSQRNNAIDFTADITLDQLNDEDVIENFNEVEDIVLESGNDGLDSDGMNVDRSLVKLSNPSNEKTNKSTDALHDVILLDEKNMWYEEQINFKVKTVVERLSKLARVLKYSYPCYRNCLERIEAKIGTPVCKLDPPRRCPSNQTHINRWKFICSRKSTTGFVGSKPEVNNTNEKTVWQLEPCEGSNTIANNAPQVIPTFVMRAVKMFEDFINLVDRVKLDSKVNDALADDDVIVLDGNEKSSTNTKTTEEESQSNVQPQWLWLLVRSNSNNQLMMFATGKYITHNTMESLKQLFETGLGKNCNVKSLYCKSITKMNNIQKSNTTFLVGTEALDETVGDLKIQLAPKTNFWLSTAGAEELAKTVESFLDPPELGTIIDIGCGLGLMGLTMARKCYQVIGIDSPSEVEEAEMTCELNKIKNAYFLMGEPTEMMATIEKSVDWRRVFAIINANTNIGRTIDVMIGLRKIKNLRRIVMVTTLTKQSVRSILELTRPADADLGDPFIATRAVVVDTLPTGPQFEVVILMERRPMPQMLDAVLSKALPNYVAQNSPNKNGKNSQKKNNSPKATGKKSNLVKNNMALVNKRLSSPGVKSVSGNNNGRNNEESNVVSSQKFVKNPFYEKPFSTKNNKKNSHQKKPSGNFKSQSNTIQRKSPASSKPVANLNQHKASIVSRPQVNLTQFQSSTTSKSQINSRSQRKNNDESLFRMRNEMHNTSFGSPHDSQKRKYDWEAENSSQHKMFISDKRPRENDDNSQSRMSGNYRTESDLLQKVKEQQRLLEVAKQKLTGSSQIVDNHTAQEVQEMLNLAIERTNQIQNEIPRSAWDRIAPPEHLSPEVKIPDRIVYKERHVHHINNDSIIVTTNNQGLTQTFDASWVFNGSSDIPPLEPNLIAPLETYTIIQSDIKSQHKDDVRSQIKTQWVPPLCSRRPVTSSKPPFMSPPKRLLSPSRGNFQPNQHPKLLLHEQDVATHRQMPTTSRLFAPSQRPPSPPPPSRPKRLGPPRNFMNRQQPPFRRQEMSSVNFGDEWDIPSRGTAEQQTNQQRTVDIRQPNNSSNWWDLNAQQDQQFQQDQFQQKTNSNLNWDGKNSGNNNWSNNIGSGSGDGGGGGGDAWNYKKILSNQPLNNQWQQQQQQSQSKSLDSRLIGPSASNWNSRGKDPMNTNNTPRNEPWKGANKQGRIEPQQNKNLWNKNCDNDDWNDLPEDARDPWGDDRGSSGSQQGNRNRNMGSNDWSMIKDNWKNPGPSPMNSKPQWPSNLYSNSNMNNARWNDRGINNDNTKNLQSNTNWQQGKNNSNNNNSNNTNNGWGQQNAFGAFQQRPYN